ncbi:MAG TPA: hypothetical protein VF339_12625 [Gammaproteobacteria bacterium]
MQPVSGGSEPTRTQTASVSAEFSTVVGIQPVVGRAFLPEVRALPGVDAVAGVSLAPGASGGWDGTLVKQTQPDQIASFEQLTRAARVDPVTALRSE